MQSGPAVQRSSGPAVQRSSGPAVQRVKLIPMVICAAATALITSLGFISARRHQEPLATAPPTTPEIGNPSLSLIDSLLASPSVPPGAEIALLNLACTPETTSSRSTQNMDQNLRTLDQWASVVADQTQRNFHRYLENPKEFSSEAEWRMAMMVTVLGQDFKVRYDPSLTSTAQQNASNQKFFSNPASVFLTGCLNGSHIGTCASLPVLYVAIGRRLGYPMHLVTAKSHLFARWDDDKGNRVNLEAANAGGYVSHPDSHYRTWPYPISPQEEKAGGYLLNLTAPQTLAVFLSTRAACLQSAGKSADAIAAAAAAFRLAPNLGGIADALRYAVTGSSQMRQQELDELQYFQQMASQNAAMDPMDPTPRINMPSSYGQSFVPMTPPIPRPTLPPQPPFGQFPQSPSPHAPR